MRLQPEQAIEVAHVVDARIDLRRDLLLGTEDVRVVLRARSRTRVSPCSVPVELVAVERRGLGVPDRKVPVAAKLALKRSMWPGQFIGLMPYV